MTSSEISQLKQVTTHWTLRIEDLNPIGESPLANMIKTLDLKDKLDERLKEQYIQQLTKLTLDPPPQWSRSGNTTPPEEQDVKYISFSFNDVSYYFTHVFLS